MHRLDGSRLSQYRPNSIHRRQDLEPLYYHDGSVVAVRREALFAAQGNPDYYAECSETFGVPSNWSGCQVAFDGAAYTGLVLTTDLRNECGAREYLQFISERVGAPIALVGVGPGREQVIWTDAGRGTLLADGLLQAAVPDGGVRAQAPAPSLGTQAADPRGV